MGGRRRLPRTGFRPGEFRPDIEGLRAVAVLAVVLFHAGLPGTGGGFVGVDVFFVISGFLITGMLFDEAARTGTVQLARFYGARARRLLPAAATVLIVTVVGAVLLLPPLQARSVIADGIAGALYVGNYRFAVEGTDYLAAEAPSPLQHYWSLGVEEQFYLVWPALILAVVWLRGRTTHRAGVEAMRSPVPYLVVLGALAALSLAACVVCTRIWPAWAFFGLPTRAWELAAGGLLALTAHRWRRLTGPQAALVGWVGLGLIVAACSTLSESTPYPGTAALLPVLGTVLVIGAGCAFPDLGAGRFLSWRTMRALGRVSYSWYLWHWPVLLLGPVLLGTTVGLPGRLGLVLASLGLAILTLHTIENPARFAAALRSSAGRSLALGGVATAAAVCAGLVLLSLRPVPTGQGEAPAPAAIAAPAPTTSSAAPKPPSPAERIMAAVAAPANLGPVPANLTPSLAAAPAAKPAMFTNGCVRSWREVGVPDCVSGDPAGRTTVVLFGDSHAAMWESALNPIAEQAHWRLQTFGKVTCPPQQLAITSPYLGRAYTECRSWREQVLARLRSAPPHLVVLDMSRRYGADFGFTSYDKAWVAGLGTLVGELRRLGSEVLVLGPVPDPHSTVPTCLSAHMRDAGACSPVRSAALNADGIAAEAAATRAAGGHYADLGDLFCTARRCPVVVGNTLVFRDDNHITMEYAALVAPVLAEHIRAALA